MKRRTKIIAAAVALVIGIWTAVILANPLRRSDASVHALILNKVPPGSTLNALKEAAQREGWRINSTWTRGPHSDWGGIDGETVAWIYLGGYWNVFRTDLDSFWAFDESGKLVDVRIRRMTDGL